MGRAHPGRTRPRPTPPVARTAAVAATITLALAAGALSMPEAAAAEAAAAANAVAPANNVRQEAGSLSSPGAAGLSAAETPAPESPSAKAQRTGQPVVVEDLTTPTTEVVANPSGSYTMTATSEPVRTQRDGAWLDLDPTLTRAGAALRPAVTTSAVELSGGGTAPLAVLERDGRRLAFTWPTALPAPVLDGASAVYPQVLPDVDLRVTATRLGGFTHTLVVKTPQAARDPRIATLTLGVAGEGLTVVRRPDGSLTAQDTAGAAVFTAPVPLMWDSRTQAAPPTPVGAGAPSGAQSPSGDGGVGASADGFEATDVSGAADGSTADAPGTEASVAPVAAAVGGSTLTLTPDPALLTGPDTVFPVYIDPTWGPTEATGSTWVQSGCKTATNWTTTAWKPGVGYNRWQDCIGIERSYWSIPAGFDVTHKIINNVKFSATEVYSAAFACDAKYAVKLWQAGPIGAGTTWNSMERDPYRRYLTEIPDLGGANQPASGNSPACGNTLADFWIPVDAIKGELWKPSLTFSLTGPESSSTTNNGFKRFDRKTTLIIDYNTLPGSPGDRNAEPRPYVNVLENGVPKLVERQGCLDGTPSTPGYLGRSATTQGLTLWAVPWDPDGQLVRAHFAVSADTNGSPAVATATTGLGPNQQWAGAPINLALQDGRTYWWSVKSIDSTGTESNWAPSCRFTVDHTTPATTAITSEAFPAIGSGTPPTGWAGDPATFTVSGSDTGSGIAFYEWAINNAIPTGTGSGSRVPANPDGSATISLPQVPRWGGNTLYVQAVDKAGNRSVQPKAYSFYAPFKPGTEAVRGDVDGDKSADLVTTGPDGGLYRYSTTHPDTATMVSDGPNSPDGGTWANVQTSHRGTAGELVDGLWAHPAGSATLYRYGSKAVAAPIGGTHYFTRADFADVQRPTACTGDCAGYNPAAKWSNTTQILAIGDADKPENALDGSQNFFDLLTLETGPDGHQQLWLFTASTIDNLVEARKLSSAGWDNVTLIAPGDTTGDKLPELWVRDNTTGTVYQYASHLTGTTGDVARYADHTARTVVARGLTASEYPVLSSDGDFEKDGYADLWGIAPDGRIALFPGKAPDNAGAFGPVRTIRSSTTPGWATCDGGLCGPILAKYRSLRGNPVTGVATPTTITPDGAGRYAHLTDGTSIYWHPDTGAHAIGGWIYNKWAEIGWETSYLGYPTSDQLPTGVDGGYYNTFAGHGAIYSSNASGAHIVHGEIYNRYRTAGGPAALGYPFQDETTAPDGVGKYNHFGTGSIYWHPTSGAHAVSGWIHTKWAELGYEQGLGYPTTSELATTDGTGRYNHFTNNASIYSTQATGAHAVTGNIRNKWAELGWEKSALGYPVSDEAAAANSGRFSDFQQGSVYWHPTHGAHAVTGWIHTKWTELGRENGTLGYPTTDQLTTPDGTGTYNHFANNASIYSTATTGAHAIAGNIRTKWAALGWETGLGYPTTDEATAPDGVGRYNHFRRPADTANTASIYWTPTTGAHNIRGAIRTAWAQNGWEAGRFGYPTTDEYTVTSGNRNDFQHGWIAHNTTTGTITTG